jgi:hypothetical protein
MKVYCIYDKEVTEVVHKEKMAKLKVCLLSKHELGWHTHLLLGSKESTYSGWLTLLHYESRNMFKQCKFETRHLDIFWKSSHHFAFVILWLCYLWWWQKLFFACPKKEADIGPTSSILIFMKYLNIGNNLLT